MQLAAPRERIAAIDALRGFALFGILLVNMGLFAMPWVDGQAAAILFPGPADQAASWTIRFFAENKFVSLFAFLFGLSIWLQGERPEQAQRQRPRLWWLLFFGLAHAVLIWSGDILVLYALLGLILLRLRHLSPRLLTWLILAGLALPVLAGALSGPSEAPEPVLSDLGQMLLRVYQGGSYAEILLVRLLELLMIYLGLVVSAGASQVFALMLTGLLAGKLGLFRQIPQHLPLFRRVLRWGLPIGAAGSLLLTVSEGSPLRYALGSVVGGTAMGLAYGAGLLLLTQQPSWAAPLRWLETAGRMAFTNYLSQSIICTTLFYGYGLGLYGKVGPTAGVLLTCLIFGFQLVASHLWLKHFRLGPFEWLWRSLASGQLQPLRRCCASGRYQR